MRPFLLTAVAVNVLASLACCCPMAAPPAAGPQIAKQEKAAAPPKVEPKKDEPKTIEVRVTAADLLADYKANEIDGNNKYKGKWIEVTGISDRVATDILGDQYLTLKSGKKFDVFSVQCFFRKNWDLSNVRPDRIYTVRGRCTGMFGNVSLKDCEID